MHRHLGDGGGDGDRAKQGDGGGQDGGEEDGGQEPTE